MRLPIFICSFLFLTSLFSQNQNTYDEKMIAVTEDTANKIRNKMENLKVAVWDFTSTLKTKGEQDELGEFISQDFSIHFANINDRIEVLDRDHFKAIMKEHGLNAEKYIAEDTAKKIGQFTHADAVITGTVDVGYDSLILRIKIIHIETASQLAASKAYIPISEDLRAILKQTDFRGIPSQQPRVNTSEKQNNTRNASIEACEQQNTGDYFIKNTTGRTQLLDIRNGLSYQKSFSIGDKQTLSLLNLPTGNYAFTAYVDGVRTIGNIGGKTSGQFRVEQCKSFTYYLGSSVIAETKNEKKPSVNRKKNYRICFKNISSYLADFGNLKVSLYNSGHEIRSINIENGKEKCFYNLKQNAVYSYTYRNYAIGERKGEVLIEDEITTVDLKNH